VRSFALGTETTSDLRVPSGRGDPEKDG